MSSIKFSASRRACKALELNVEINNFPSKSGVSEQPVGMEETLCGAIHRAFEVRVVHPDAICIGIENGIVREVDDGYLDFAYVALLLPNMEWYCAMSQMVRFPRADVRKALASGVTAGSVIAERTGCDPTDPHSFLTDGEMSREDQLVEPLVRLLKKAAKELS